MKAVIFEADGVLLGATVHMRNDGQAVAIDGAKELLAILRRLDIKVGVLASSDLAGHMQSSGFAPYVHSLVVSNERSIDPEKRGLTGAITALGSEPEHTVIVSNRVLDILTGKEGKLAKTIGVSYGNGNRAALKAAGADHVINDIPSLLDVLE